MFLGSADPETYFYSCLLRLKSSHMQKTPSTSFVRRMKEAPLQNGLCYYLTVLVEFFIFFFNCRTIEWVGKDKTPIQIQLLPWAGTAPSSGCPVPIHSLSTCSHGAAVRAVLSLTAPTTAFPPHIQPKPPSFSLRPFPLVLSISNFSPRQKQCNQN